MGNNSAFKGLNDCPWTKAHCSVAWRLSYRNQSDRSCAVAFVFQHNKYETLSLFCFRLTIRRHVRLYVSLLARIISTVARWIIFELSVKYIKKIYVAFKLAQSNRRWILTHIYIIQLCNEERICCLWCVDWGRRNTWGTNHNNWASSNLIVCSHTEERRRITTDRRRR